MTTGRILQFDETRGFGFIAADDGGEDVFLHASVFSGESGELVPGARVEFEVMAGDRGRKAFAVRLVSETTDGFSISEPEENFSPAGRSGPYTPIAPSHAAEDEEQETAGTARAEAKAETGLGAGVEYDGEGEGEGVCDLLSPADFGHEVTELLLERVPSLTGGQLVQVRESLLEFAMKRGWVDA